MVDVLDWADKMVPEREWADAIAVRAAAFMFGPIAVFRPANPDQPPSIFLPVDDTILRRPLILLELDETSEGAEHYNPLVVPIAPPIPASWSQKAGGAAADDIDVAATYDIDGAPLSDADDDADDDNDDDNDGKRCYNPGQVSQPPAEAADEEGRFSMGPGR